MISEATIKIFSQSNLDYILHKNIFAIIENSETRLFQ